jgi:hypothetical protein
MRVLYALPPQKIKLPRNRTLQGVVDDQACQSTV